MIDEYLSTEYLERESKRIITLIKNDFVMEDGSLFLEKNKSDVLKKHIYPDLGDYVPFFLYFKEYDFVEKDFNNFTKLLKNGHWVSEFPTFSINNLVKSYEYTDMILGLHNYALTAHDEKVDSFLRTFADNTIRLFKLDGNLSSFFHEHTSLNIPAIDTRDGMFIEVFIELGKYFKEQKYFDVAENLYNKFISSKFYKKNKLFPVFDSNSIAELFLPSTKFNTIKITKNNTNTLWGFLSMYLYNKDKEVLDHIDTMVKEIHIRASLNGGIVGSYSRDFVDDISLTASFSVMDFLCDLYDITKNKSYLDFAEEIADYWIFKQGKTGLFPEDGRSSNSFLDSETDMVVALYKIYEITEKVKYKQSADLCFVGIVKYHSLNDYPLKVDIDSGLVTDHTQRTKFIALFLKLLILKINLNNGISIFKNQELFDLIKDR